jgi:tetratricopeptide (TPR) repeat protein
MEGVRAQREGDFRKAESAYLEVLGKGGRAAFVYNNLGIVYYQLGEYPHAITQFRSAIDLQPSYVAPRVFLGASYLFLNKIPEAKKELEAAVGLDPRDPLARLQLAKVNDKAGNLIGVTDQLKILRQLQPQDADYAYQLGDAYLKLSAWCYQEIARRKPRPVRAYQTMAESYRLQGRGELAIQTYQLAAQADPKLPELHLSMAQIYFEQGKVTEAIREVENELAIVPESKAALELKGKLQAATISSEPRQP